ncbi:ankyrin repeat-containing domain protein [Ustulina deusta]|nr:ankyrin repeat-containing domain protein [Ustulina deusta]
MVNILIEFGADIYASDENGKFSALHLVLDEHAMKYWSGSSPQVISLQKILIEKAMKDRNTNHSQILAEHAIRHGKKGLLKSLCREDFNMEFCQSADFGLSSESTAMTCAAQFCPKSQEDPWDLWLGFVFSLMPPGKRHFNNWPAHLFINPLVYAAGAGNHAAIRYFLSLGGDLDAQNQDGIFPLIAAVAHGHTNTCELLLSLGVDGNKVGSYGLTAMHVAAMTGQYEMIQLLAGMTQNKNGAVHKCQGLEAIFFRLSIHQRWVFPLHDQSTALDIVRSQWRAVALNPPVEHEESFKLLLRNGFCLSVCVCVYLTAVADHLRDIRRARSIYSYEIYLAIQA